MDSRLWTPACIACVLALSAPAYAASEEAPGALKKQAPTPELAAPVTTDTAPAPAANVRSQTKGQSVTKDPVKQVAQPQTTSAPAPASPATSNGQHRGTTRRAAASTPAASRAAKPNSKRTALARGRSHAVPVRAHGRAGAPGQQVAAGAPYTAPGQAPVAHAKSDVAPGTQTAPKPTPAKAKANGDDETPLASITQAADHVVEVIPGAVVLLLAGLVALVMMLILRSLTVERQRGKALATSYGVTVEALATAIEAKDLTTGGHIERVRRLGLLLATEIVPRETRDPQMAYGFLLHDIGKLAVPDAILRAPGRLTENQWALMRRHPEEGVQMLSHVPFLDRALDVVRHHHERWDGGGYPAGLKGDEIPLWARIFSVVDALDAMTAERPYRAARSYGAALEEIRRHSGTQFDPAVVEALERLDPALVEPLLEPTQQVEPLAELPDVEPLVAA
ncbi:MAG TPA: HD domain-containing phosphohydrolase [Thermoleophilaceae bacterium]